MFKDKVKALLESALLERSDLFLIDFSIRGDNQIQVVIDGDNGVVVDDCIFVSRAIEHNLDREEEDFSLEVMSAGATAPIVNKRQYGKNLNRFLEVKTNSEKFEGVITEANDQYITLEWKTKEAKLVGKGKVVVNKKMNIDYQDIIEAKVIIKF